jgi:DNA-binding PadR family transcriptional regulator
MRGAYRDDGGVTAVEARDVHNRLVQRRPLMPVCLLLMLGEDAGHGYELTERLKQWGFQLTGPGPVYRELRILEESGLVQSMWSAPQSGPVPRVYELTAAGRVALDEAAVELVVIQHMLDEFQTRHRGLPAPPAPVVTAARSSRDGGRTRRARRSARG